MSRTLFGAWLFLCGFEFGSFGVLIAQGGVQQVVLTFGGIGGLGLGGEGIAGIQIGVIVILRKYKDACLTPSQVSKPDSSASTNLSQKKT